VPVGRRLCLLDDCEVEAEWVSQRPADFNQVWDSLSAENRGRLVRAVSERVEVDEPSGDVRVLPSRSSVGHRGELMNQTEATGNWVNLGRKGRRTQASVDIQSSRVACVPAKGSNNRGG